MKIEKIAIGLLNHYTYNPRKDLKPEDLEYQKIKASINEFGYIDPIIWNKQTGNIVGGHQRFKVLFRLGYNEFDCVVVDFDPITEKKANLALNKISGEWDEEKLSQLLNELRIENIDFSSTGFSENEIEKLIANVFKSEVFEDEFDIDAEIEEISKTKEALFKLATGYEYEEKEIIADKYGNAGKIKIMKKHNPPDIQAILLYEKIYKNK